MSDDLLTDGNNDSFTVYIQTVYQEISDGVYRILFALNTMQASSRYVSQISVAIQTIQLIGILFTLNGSVSLIPWSQIHAGPVITFCSLFSEIALESVILSQAVFQLAIAFVGVLLGGAITIVVLMKRDSQIALLLELYSLFTKIMMSVAFVPVIRVLIQHILFESALNKILALAAFIPYVAVTVCYISTVYDANPLSKSSSARSHSRIDLLYTVSKVVLVIISVGSRSPILLSLAAFVLSLSISYLFTMYLPYYDLKLMQYHAAFSWIFTWASLSAVVASIYNNDSSGGAVFMLLGGIPVVVLSSYLIVQGRFEHIRIIPISDLKNPWELHIRFRIMAQDIDLSATKNAMLKRHKTIEKDVSDKADDQQNVIIELSNDERVDTDGQHAKTSDFHECKALLISSLARFPDSSHLLLAAASFHIDISRVYFLAYMYLDQVSSLSPKPDERFLLYRIQRTIEDRIFESESNSEIIQYNNQKELLECAQNLDLRIVQAMIEFWSEALKSKPDEDKMRLLAVQISSESKTAYSSYSKAIAISDDSIMAMQSYSGFMLTVLRDSRTGERLLEKASEMQQAKSKIKQASAFKDLLFDDRAAVVLISGNMRNLGCIIDCNLRAAQLLGFSKSILIGKSSRIFLPEPFASHHDSMLLRNLQAGETKMLDAKSNLIILHQNGYVQDVNIFVKAFVKNLTTLCFIGVIESTNPDLLVAIYDRVGVVTAISQTVSMHFGIEKDRLDSHDVHAEDLIPDIEAHHAAFRKAIISNPDYIRIISIVRDGVKFQIAIRFQTWTLLNDDVAVILRIDILGKQVLGDIASGSSSELLKPAVMLDEVPISVNDNQGDPGDSDSGSGSSRSSRSDSQDAGNNLNDSEAASSVGDQAASSVPEERRKDHAASSHTVPQSQEEHKEANFLNDGSDDEAAHEIQSSGAPVAGVTAAVTIQGTATTPGHADASSPDLEIEPYYPELALEKTPGSHSRGSKSHGSRSRGSKRQKGARSRSKNSKSRDSDEQSLSGISTATSNAGASSEMNSDAVQKRLEQTLMRWLHRAFLAVFLLLAAFSLGQVFVSQKIVAEFLAALAVANFTGEFGADVLRLADASRSIDLISRGLISDTDGSVVSKHVSTIQKFTVIAGTCRDSLLQSRHGWDPVVMQQLKSPYMLNFCTASLLDDCIFETTILDAIDLYRQLSKEIASVPVGRLDLINSNSLYYIFNNVHPLSEISHALSGFGSAAAKEQNRLIVLANLTDLVLQVLSAVFLFLYAVRATVVGVQLRNDQAMIMIFYVPSSAVKDIINPYSDRLAILQKTDELESEGQDERMDTSFNNLTSSSKEKSGSESSKHKRLKRIESQIRKASKFKTRRILQYLFKFGQLVVLYGAFFTFRHIEMKGLSTARAPMPARFQFGWRSGSLLRRAVFNTRELMLASADMLLSRSAVNNTAELHALIDADIAEAEALRRSLLFGGVFDGTYYPGCLTAGAGHFDLEFSTVCFVPDVQAANPDCDTFANGLALNGRQALFSEEIRLIYSTISAFDAEIRRIRSDPNFAPGVQTRDNFLRAQLQSPDYTRALKIDNTYLGHLTRYFAHLLTDDRFALAVKRSSLDYLLIVLVVVINLYGYFGVVMSSLRDIAREFTQTQDLLKFVPFEIRQSILKNAQSSKSRRSKVANSDALWIVRVLSFVLRILRRLPLISTAVLFAILSVCVTLFTRPEFVWKSMLSNPKIAVASAADTFIATWTPLGFGFLVNNLSFDTIDEETTVRMASHIGQAAVLSISAVVNAFLGRPIVWTIVILGTLGAIVGNVFSYFVVEGVFDHDLISLISIAFFLTFSVALGIGQRYLSARTFKRFKTITGADNVDVFLFGMLSGIFASLIGASAGAFLFFMADFYFQLHSSVAFPTCILVGALDSIFMIGFHQLLGIEFVNFSSEEMLSILLPIIFLLSPILCYLNAKSEQRFFKELLVIATISCAVFMGMLTSGVGAWLYVYEFICTLIIWFPVCASSAVGGSIRSAAYEDF